MEVKKKINIEKDLYYHILRWLNYDIFFWGLSEGDIKIFSEIYKKNNFIRESVSKEKERMTILFSKETLQDIQKNLNISYNTFHNSLSKLRKKGLIVNNNIDDRIFPKKLNPNEFTFTIKITNIEE